MSLLDQLAQLRHSGHSGQPRPNPEASRVRRALFGPVDHEENRRFVQRELERNRREASERWNYDFELDTPIQGRFLWEPIKDKKEAKPEMESSKPEMEASKPEMETSKPEVKPVDCDRKTMEKAGQSQRATAKITDHFQVQKKRSRSKVKTQERKSSRDARLPSKDSTLPSRDANLPSRDASQDNKETAVDEKPVQKV